jgi:parallel beta-helix repeat protein
MRLTVGFFLGMGMVSCVCAELNLYVAADAAAGGDGSRRSPYLSLTQARDGIRALRQAGTLKSGEAVTVSVGDGVYRFDTTFELLEQDGGTAEAPVVYRAQKRGKARIHGGVTLSSDAFKPLTDASVLSRIDPSARAQILVCDVSAAAGQGFSAFKTAYQGVPAGPWLYVNRQPMTLARWPNADAPEAGWAGFSKAVDTGLPKADSEDPMLRKPHPGAFVLDDPRPARWNLTEGVWLLGYWTHDWCDEVIRIASYDKEKQVITLAAPHSYGISGGTWGSAKRRFFALNALEELDAPGEWYLYRARKLLYFYPSESLKDALIILATLSQPLVKVSGAKHVKFVELAFEYAHSDGIVLSNSTAVEIAGCVVANCAASGISVSGTDNIVRSCDVFNLGKNGLQLNGGDRKSLTLAKNLAVNNHIHHYGLFQRTYAPGIGVQGCGQIVRNNSIHDAPHNAVLYGGNEHLFELNEIYRVVMETGDAGAFYTGRDWTSRGNVLRHNYIHDLGGGDAKHVNTMGVYLDDCDCGDTIEGNIFVRAGRAIMIGGGRDNPVLNNLVVDCPIGLHIDSRGMTWPHWNNKKDPSWCLDDKAKAFNYTQPPWSVKYPRLASIMSEEPREPLYNPIRRNVFVDCTKQVCDFDGNVKKLLDKFEIAENLAVNSSGSTNGQAKAVECKGFANLAGTAEKPAELGFADRAAGDFTLRRNARLLKELPAFEKIPFEKIGLFKDEYRRKLPVR